jgi:hypothetical protein
VTEIYEQGENPRNNADQIKTAKIPDFSGTGLQVDALSWLDKVLTAAKTGNLTHEAALDLLRAKSSGQPFKRLQQLRRDRLDLVRTVAIIENEFANVPSPEEALTQVNNLIKPRSESLASFAIRVRSIAQMGARNQLTPELREALEMQTSRANFMRVLSSQTHRYVTDLEVNHAKAGRPKMDLNALVEAAQSFERNLVNRGRRLIADEELQSMLYQGKRSSQTRERYPAREQMGRVKQFERPSRPDKTKQNQVYQNRRVQEDADNASVFSEVYFDNQGNPHILEDEPSDEEQDLSSAEESLASDSSVDDDDVYEVIRFMRRMGDRGRFRGRRESDKPRKRFIPWKNMKRNKSKDNRKREPRKVSQVAAAYRMDSRRAEKQIPGLLSDMNPKPDNRDLPKMANCLNENSRCIRCGLITTPPHRSSDPECQLAQHPLTSAACMSCNKGLHSADNCLMPHRKNYRHPADQDGFEPKN